MFVKEPSSSSNTYIAVNVAPIDGVGAHVGVEIPDADRIVTRAGHERASGQNALHAFFGRGVRFYAPDASGVVQKRMRFANLPLKKQKTENITDRKIFFKNND